LLRFGQRWDQLQVTPGSEAKIIFADLQRRYPGRFLDGQLRTLQREGNGWRVLEGPPKEVFFPQEWAGLVISVEFYPSEQAAGADPEIILYPSAVFRREKIIDIIQL
jgi:hypothetical protein